MNDEKPSFVTSIYSENPIFMTPAIYFAWKSSDKMGPRHCSLSLTDVAFIHVPPPLSLSLCTYSLIIVEGHIGIRTRTSYHLVFKVQKINEHFLNTNLKKIKTKFKLFTYVTDWKGNLPLRKKQLSVRKTSKYLEDTFSSI